LGTANYSVKILERIVSNVERCKTVNLRFSVKN